MISEKVVFISKSGREGCVDWKERVTESAGINQIQSALKVSIFTSYCKYKTKKKNKRVKESIYEYLFIYLSQLNHNSISILNVKLRRLIPKLKRKGERM